MRRVASSPNSVRAFAPERPYFIMWPYKSRRQGPRLRGTGDRITRNTAKYGAGSAIGVSISTAQSFVRAPRSKQSGSCRRLPAYRDDAMGQPRTWVAFFILLVGWLMTGSDVTLVGVRRRTSIKDRTCSSVNTSPTARFSATCGKRWPPMSVRTSPRRSAPPAYPHQRSGRAS